MNCGWQCDSYSLLNLNHSIESSRCGNKETLKAIATKKIKFEYQFFLLCQKNLPGKYKTRQVKIKKLLSIIIIKTQSLTLLRRLTEIYLLSSIIAPSSNSFLCL